jgi:hypothetical protein
MTTPVDPTEPDDGIEPDYDDVRRLLRGLPDVDPPEGFFDDLIRHRRRRARTVVVVGLVAAGIVGALVVADASGITGEAEPEMAALAARHATMMTSEVDGGMDEMPAPYQVPEHLGSLQAGTALRHDDDVVQIVYGEGGRYLSVFEEVGDFQDDAMDLELTPLHVQGVAAWRADDGSIIVRRSDVVYVLIGDIDPDEVVAVIEDLPDARPLGIVRRIGDAMDDLVDAFGLG